MKLCRKISLYLLLTVVLLSLSACGGKRPEATTVCVEKGGKLKQVLVDPAPDYYVEDLQSYTEDRISTYLKDSEEGEVRLNSCRETEGTVYMELSFGSAADYSAFNRMDCFLGTLQEAADAGISPPDVLAAPDGTPADFGTLLAEHPEYRMLLLSEHTLVQTNTDILYSTPQAVITDGRAAIIGDGDAGTSGYYPRKTDLPGCLIFE
ncbi:MAG: hypothetical protein Q4B85_02475 [Lachnospiraceae bacterium]|nr:hypothetical protein [Lachnospiraceae bacterium]